MRQVRTHDARWRAIDASTYSLCKWDWPDLCGTCEGGHGLLLCSVVGCINVLTRDSQSYLRLTAPKHAHMHTHAGAWAVTRRSSSAILPLCKVERRRHSVAEDGGRHKDIGRDGCIP